MFCQTAMSWTADSSSTTAPGEWTINMEVAVGEFQWQGVVAIDLTSSFLRLPEEILPQTIVALLSNSIAGECVQPHNAPANSVDAPVASGLMLCPCESSSTRPPLRLAVGSSEIVLPWSSMLRPVSGEAGLCALRLHAAAPNEAPSIGAALLLGNSHALSFDFEQEAVGICMA